MMWYVYCRQLSSGRDDCVNQIFETPQAAIKHIAKCYAIDKDLGQLGECYYFIKKHCTEPGRLIPGIGGEYVC